MRSLTLTEALEKTKVIAVKIASEELDAYDGALLIWKQILDKMDARIPDILWTFKSNASAIEDYLWNAQDSASSCESQIAQCKKDIFEAAKNLCLNNVVS